MIRLASLTPILILLGSCAITPYQSALHVTYANNDCTKILASPNSFDHVVQSGQSILIQGYCQEKLGNTIDAKSLYRQVIARYPDSIEAYSASLRLREIGQPRLSYNNTSQSKQAYLPVKTVTPIYPEVLSRSGIEGWVLLRFLVNSNGHPQDIRVVDSEPQFLFEVSAVTALQNFKWQPLVESGSTVDVENVEHLFTFQLSH